MTVTESGKIWTREKVIDHIEKALTVKRIPDFSGEDLSDLDLSLVDFNRANLYGANLSGSDLSYTTLAGCRLDCADFRDTDLRFANLSDARMYAVTFEKADLTGANLMGCELAGADFLDATLKVAILAPTTGSHFVFNAIALGYFVVMPTSRGWQVHGELPRSEQYDRMPVDEFARRVGRTVKMISSQREAVVLENLVKLVLSHCSFQEGAVSNLADIMAENHRA